MTPSILQLLEATNFYSAPKQKDRPDLPAKEFRVALAYTLEPSPAAGGKLLIKGRGGELPSSQDAQALLL